MKTAKPAEDDKTVVVILYQKRRLRSDGFAEPTNQPVSKPIHLRLRSKKMADTVFPEFLKACYKFGEGDGK